MNSTQANQVRLIQQFKQNLSQFFPIFGTHVLRIGFWRVILGGFAMYLSLPFFLLHQIVYLQLFGNWILPILTSVSRTPISDFIILDRYGIKQLPWLDRINCLYCSYANGFCMYWDFKLEQIKEVDFFQLNLIQKTMLAASIALVMPFCLIYKVHGYLVYDLIVSNFLGLHRYNSKKLYRNLHNEILVDKKRILPKLFFINELIECSRLNNGLEQIETAWCPFKNVAKYSDQVTPTHHDNFLLPDEVETAKKVLLDKGTFSERLPKW
jgi:hypothetical protein